MPTKLTPGQVGDWLEVASPGGGPPQRGRIEEVLGGPHHERYLIRWTDEYRSIHYPADGTRVVRDPDLGGSGPALP